MLRSKAVFAGLVAMVVFVGSSEAFAQRSRGGFDRGGDRSRGGGSDDRSAQIRSFIEQMRSGGDQGRSSGQGRSSDRGGSDDRASRMREFFERMRGGSGGDSGSSRWGGGSSRDSGRSRDRSRGRSSEPKPRPRVTKDLPEKYKARDKNLDGQIGMWEWERAAITEFRALDRNHDGFLTPNELVWADSPAGLAAFAMANPALATSSSTTSAPAVSTGASTSTSPFSKKEEKRAGKGRATDRTAKYVFGALDKNKDGSLSSEEWKNSFSTRSSFERAKVEMTLPMKLDKFMAIYPAPSSSRGRRGR